ncbi:OmpA family protein [Motilimonas pumila]|uniref:Glycine zipper 2TM domain-containing protein n=1 Tax=Motilimonas pumila TaxID=2303987 RepID=A0A418YE86_9GAMM|nr:OmpA family protein [Motilimonas pumila]RJG47474.1 glycine zipper 2TM domain-containing protein [Motilimonas pumila]
MKLKHLTLVPFLGLSMALTACTTVNPYTGEEQTSNAAKGSAIGAVTGALIGVAASSKSDRGKGALIGAAAGAAAGGGIGYYMDVQEAELRQKLRNTGVSVTRSGDNIILNMPNAITFAVNSSTLKQSAMPVLDSVLLVLKEYDETRVNVLGHTDSTGAESYNQLLSEKRAQSVADYLLRNQLEYARVNTLGYGESRPIASNNNEAGREQNRRVELVLSPMK